MELNELRKTAEAATPGLWECVEGDDAFGVRASVGSLTWDDHSGEVFKKEDAEFIATFDPPTVLALLSRLEQAEQAVQRVREFSDQMLKPHGQNVVVAARVRERLAEILDGDGRG